MDRKKTSFEIIAELKLRKLIMQILCIRFTSSVNYKILVNYNLQDK